LEETMKEELNLKFDADGLLPAVVQDGSSGEVLMVAWMNREALDKTLETGQTHFWSRSRRKMWLKGESSGHTQQVEEILVDCDQDVLLVKVKQAGGACHVGYRSCFYRRLEGGRLDVVGRRVFDPKEVY